MRAQPQVTVPSGRHLRLVPGGPAGAPPRWRFVVRGLLTALVLGAVVVGALVVLALPLGAQDLAAAERALKAGNAREARQVAEAAIKANPADAAARYWAGRAAFAQEQYGAATGHFEEATKLAASNALYHEWYGNALGNEAMTASKVRQPFLARRMKAAWEAAIRLDPTTIEARASLIQFYVQAPGFMGGSKDKAFAVAEEITRLDPRRGWEEVGKLHEREKRWAEAEKAYLAGAGYPSERPLMQFRLALLYANSGQPARSLDAYEAILKAHPQERAALYAIGRVASVSGQRLDRGADALQEYLSEPPRPGEPSLANAQYRLGLVRERQGRTEEARLAFQSALKLDARHKEARAALNKLG